MYKQRLPLIVANVDPGFRERLRLATFATRTTISNAIREGLELWLAHVEPEAAQQMPLLYQRKGKE